MDIGNPAMIKQCDAVVLEYYHDIFLYIVTDCEGNEYKYRAFWKAKKKYAEIEKKFA
jgi:hypothetical protein